MLLEELHRQGMSQRRACTLAGVARSSGRYSPLSRDDTAVVTALREHSAAHPREGYRKAAAAVSRRLGRRVNAKKVYRLWRWLRLCVPPKRKRRRRGKSAPAPRRACYPRHVWSYDFMEDSCMEGRKLRFLNIVDEFTRECFRVSVRRSFPAAQVIEQLREVFAQHGCPKYLRSDNGPEFIARAIQTWLGERPVQTLYIDPGCPWQNGFIESFNASFRTECLDMEVFLDEADAAGIAERYRRYYNEERPHGGLGYQSPLFFKQQWLSATGALPPDPRSLALCRPPECSGARSDILAAAGANKKPCLRHGHSVGPAAALGSLSSVALSSGPATKV